MAKTLDLSEYLDEGQQVFADALAAAEAVLKDGDAMQDEVDQSWRGLLKAMSELRLKPNKDALKDLINEANGMSTEGADEETIAVFQNALAAAMSVYDDEQATEEEVMTAEEGLQAALDQLHAAVGIRKIRTIPVTKVILDPVEMISGRAVRIRIFRTRAARIRMARLSQVQVTTVQIFLAGLLQER